VDVGLLPWLERCHADTTRSLTVYYSLYNDFAHYTGPFLRCLARFRGVSTLRLSVDDASISVPRLAWTLRRLVCLRDISLDLSLRSDVDGPAGAALAAAVYGCQRVSLRMYMSDVEDCVLRSFLRVCQTQPEPPRWQELHLRLKHNLISDKGAGHLAAIVHLSPRLERLIVNLSYNPVGYEGRMRLLELPESLQRCVLKMDTDMVESESEMFRWRFPAPPRMEHYSVSLAFSVLGDFETRTLGSQLASLDLDMEGCSSTSSTLPTLTAALACMRETLRSLTLRFAYMNLSDEPVMHLCDRGIGTLHGLHTLALYLNGNGLTDAGMGVIAGALPRSVEHLTLDCGDNRGIHAVDLAVTAAALHTVVLPGVCRGRTAPRPQRWPD
jgi:hypothetical protein